MLEIESKVETKDRVSNGQIRNILIDDGQPPLWLNDDEIQEAIKSIMSDASNEEVFFMNQFLYFPDTMSESFMERTYVNYAKKHMMGHHRYLAWFVNTTESSSSVNTQSIGRGDHWCIILVDLGKSIRTLTMHLHQDPDTTVTLPMTVYFFNPFGDSIRKNIRRNVDLVLKRLVPEMLKEHDITGAYEMMYPEHPNTIVLDGKFQPIKTSLNTQISHKTPENGKVQLDACQCGVYCIWFIQQFLRHKHLNVGRYEQPSKQRLYSDMYRFRSNYFKHPVNDDTAPDLDKITVILMDMTGHKAIFVPISSPTVVTYRSKKFTIDNYIFFSPEAKIANDQPKRMCTLLMTETTFNSIVKDERMTHEEAFGSDYSMVQTSSFSQQSGDWILTPSTKWMAVWKFPADMFDIPIWKRAVRTKYFLPVGSYILKPDNFVKIKRYNGTFSIKLYSKITKHRLLVDARDIHTLTGQNGTTIPMISWEYFIYNTLPAADPMQNDPTKEQQQTLNNMFHQLKQKFDIGAFSCHKYHHAGVVFYTHKRSLMTCETLSNFLEDEAFVNLLKDAVLSYKMTEFEEWIRSWQKRFSVEIMTLFHRHPTGISGTMLRKDPHLSSEYESFTPVPNGVYVTFYRAQNEFSLIGYEQERGWIPSEYLEDLNFQDAGASSSNAGASSSSTLPTDVTITTYNVLFAENESAFQHQDGKVIAWETRKNAVIKCLDQRQSSITCVQQINQKMLDEISSSPEYVMSSSGYVSTAIFWDDNVFDLEKRMPTSNFSMCTCILRHKVSKQTFCVTSIHTKEGVRDSDESERKNILSILMKNLEDVKADMFIICGGFNSDEKVTERVKGLGVVTNKVHPFMREQEYTDVVEFINQNRKKEKIVTYNGWAPLTYDYIYVKSLVAYSCTDYKINPVHDAKIPNGTSEGSDHVAVTAIIQMD